MAEESSGSLSRLIAVARDVRRRLLAVAGNRYKLLLVELREERDRLLLTVVMAIVALGLALLALLAASAAIVVLLWPYAPVATLVILAVLYGAAAGIIGLVLVSRQRSARPLAATLDQLAKDRIAITEALS